MKIFLFTLTLLFLPHGAHAKDGSANKLKNNQTELILDCKTEGGSYSDNKYYPMNPFNLLLKINLRDGSFSGEYLVVLAPFLNDANRPPFEIKETELLLVSKVTGQIYSHDYKLRINRLNGKGISELKTQYTDRDGQVKLSRNEYRLDCIRITERKF